MRPISVLLVASFAIWACESDPEPTKDSSAGGDTSAPSDTSVTTEEDGCEDARFDADGCGEPVEHGDVDATTVDDTSTPDTTSSTPSGTGTIVFHESGSEETDFGSYTYADQVSLAVTYGAARRTAAGPLVRWDVDLLTVNSWSATCNGHEASSTVVNTQSFDVSGTSSDTSHNPSAGGDFDDSRVAGQLTLIKNGSNYEYTIDISVGAGRATSWSSTFELTQSCGNDTNIHKKVTETTTTRVIESETCGEAEPTDTQDFETGVGLGEGYDFTDGTFEPSSGFIDVTSPGTTSTNCREHFCTPGGVTQLESFSLSTCSNAMGGSLHLPVSASWFQ